MTHAISRKTPLKKSFLVKFLCFLNVVSFAGFLGCYLFQVNALTEETYLVQEYQQRSKETSAENAELEMRLSQTNSLGKVKELVAGMNFEKTTHFRYIKLTSSEVAVRTK